MPPRTPPRALLLATLLLLLAAAAPAAAEPGRVLVVRSPVGRQYLTLGAEAGAWLGTGTLRALPADGGAILAEPTDPAAALGPVTVGIAHVLARSVIFEVRLGGGAVLFPDDRLISTRLASPGKLHVGWQAGGEVIGRYFGASGFTAGLGMQLAGIGLPEASSRYLRVAPRVGWIGWDDRFDSFFTVELALGGLLINGLIPDFQGPDEAPIESQWGTAGVYVGWGF